MHHPILQGLREEPLLGLDWFLTPGYERSGCDAPLSRPGLPGTDFSVSTYLRSVMDLQVHYFSLIVCLRTHEEYPYLSLPKELAQTGEI